MICFCHVISGEIDAALLSYLDTVIRKGNLRLEGPAADTTDRTDIASPSLGGGARTGAQSGSRAVDVLSLLRRRLAVEVELQGKADVERQNAMDGIAVGGGERKGVLLRLLATLMATREEEVWWCIPRV